jgi:hypothetical protein
VLDLGWPQSEGEDREKGGDMNDFRLMNGTKKVTVIERFNGSTLLLCGIDRVEFLTLADCKKHISENGLEVGMSFIFGSSVKRELQNGG